MDAPLCRSASPDDVPQILTYVRELAAWEGRPDAATASAHDLRELLFGSHPLAEAVMLLDPAAGTPVGYAWFYLTTATFTGRAILYLEDLYVTPAARGLGLGARAMAWLANVARERGCACLDWSVVEGNDQAIGFYESLGAKPKHGSVSYRLSGEALQHLASQSEK